MLLSRDAETRCLTPRSDRLHTIDRVGGWGLSRAAARFEESV